MTAALAGAALEEGGAIDLGAALKEGGAIDLEVQVVGPTSRHPRMAEVRELRPATVNADTEEFPAVEEDTEPEPEAEPEHEPEFEPEPKPEPEAAQPAVPAATLPEPAPAPPAPTAVGEPEARHTFSPGQRPDAPQHWGEGALPIIYWGAMAIAFIGQVWGFGPVFGGGWWYLAAAVVGGVFELTMITSGDTALNWLARGKAKTECAAFLGISLGAAGMALYFSITHWAHINPALMPFFSGAMVAGYALHMLKNGIDAKNARKELRVWEAEMAEAERKRKEAEEAAEAERKRQAAEAEQRRREAEAEAERQKRAAEAEARAAEARKNLPKAPKQKSKRVASKDVAIQYGLAYEATTPSELTAALAKGEWLPRAESSMKDYCREVKKTLGLTA